MDEESKALEKTRDKIMIKLKEIFNFEQMKVYSNPYVNSFKSPKQIQEDGHVDKPSALRKLKVSIENAQAIINKLESSGDEQELMSWWMDKITLANDYLSKAKDFITNPTNESINEQDEPEHFGGGKNIEVLGYETKHFDICASAVSLYTKLNKVDNEEAKEYIVQSAKDLDHIFEMEKAVVRKEPLNHDPIKHGVELVNTVSFRLGYVAKLIDDDFMDETLFMPYHIEVMVDRIDDIKIDNEEN